MSLERGTKGEGGGEAIAGRGGGEIFENGSRTNFEIMACTVRYNAMGTQARAENQIFYELPWRSRRRCCRARVRTRLMTGM